MTRGATVHQRPSVSSPRSPSHSPPVLPPPQSAPIDLAALSRCSFDELRALWRQTGGRSGGRGEPPAQKCLLLREIAWRAQSPNAPRRAAPSLAWGLDAHTARLLAAAVRSAEHASNGKREERPSERQRSSTCPRPSGPSRSVRRSARIVGELKPGSRLVRIWRGRTFEVEVIDDQRFRFAGREYSSLSEVARVITGTHWSGPRFFGIVARTRSGA